MKKRNLPFNLLSYILFLFGVFTSCTTDSVTIEPEIDTTPLTPARLDLKTAPCEDGFAGIFPCDGYNLQYHLTLAELGFPNAEGNDSWGWTDPLDNKEYAIIGTSSGTAFVDITDPIKPIVKGRLLTATEASDWRDVKVYNNHAFIVSEASGHGMQVFDLTKLREESPTPVIYTADARYTEITTAHNIVINEDKGVAYIVGTQRNDDFLGGVTFVDIQNPKAPVAAGGYGANGYSHDGQVVTYNGPDTNFTGRELYIGSNENEVIIADVTDKSNPIMISTMDYNNLEYTHQGWFDEDQRYFFVGDEQDELFKGLKTRTLVFDLSDLTAPKLHMEYSGPISAIDHNGYVKGATFFLANYAGGVRMIDISDVANKNMREIGFFDTRPNSDQAVFEGVWNVYPYFPSGNIIASDIEGGLFIIKKAN